jgi:Meiotically up-regulated gene 113
VIYFAKIVLGQFNLVPRSWSKEFWLKPNPEFTRDLFFIKIGMSAFPTGRMSSLKTEYGYPATLLAMMPGGAEEEAAMHQRFAHLRLEGIGRKPPEWFYPTKELMDFIRGVEEKFRDAS